MKITLNRPSVYPFNGVMLMPGENAVSDKDAKMLLSQKGVQRDIERGILTVEKPKAGRPRKEPEADPEATTKEAE